MWAGKYQMWASSKVATDYYKGKHLYRKWAIRSIYRVDEAVVMPINNRIGLFHCTNKKGEPVTLTPGSVGGFIEFEYERSAKRATKMLELIANFEG